MSIYTISNPNHVDFILVTFDSIMNAFNINYKDSDSELFKIISSSIDIIILNLANIKDIKHIVDIHDCNHVSLAEINLINTTNITDSLFQIKKPVDVSLANIILANLT